MVMDKMFEIKSYIKNISPKSGYIYPFIEVSEISEIKKIMKLIDMDYIEGAITIKYYSEYILDFSYWDYVDQLWSYFLDLIENFIMYKTSTINFPDQPIKISLKKNSSRNCIIKIISKIGTKSYVVPTLEFINAMLSSCEEFCICFEQIFGFSMKEESTKIKFIRSNLKNIR